MYTDMCDALWAFGFVDCVQTTARTGCAGPLPLRQRRPAPAAGRRVQTVWSRDTGRAGIEVYVSAAGRRQRCRMGGGGESVPWKLHVCCTDVAMAYAPFLALAGVLFRLVAPCRGPTVSRSWIGSSATSSPSRRVAALPKLSSRSRRSASFAKWQRRFYRYRV